MAVLSNGLLLIWVLCFSSVHLQNTTVQWKEEGKKNSELDVQANPMAMPNSLNSYHNYESLVKELKGLEARHPQNAVVYSLGKSVEDRDILGIRIGATTGERELLKPMVKIVANMHGNEAIGRELTLGLAHLLLDEFSRKSNPEVVEMVQGTDIHLIPSMNPDGFERAKEGDCDGQNLTSGRQNSKDVDLNRNFPGWNDFNKTREELLENRAPETQSMMKYILDNPFVLSLNFHGGSDVVSYPFDDLKDSLVMAGVVSRTPDHDFFLHISKIYAKENQRMMFPVPVCRDDNFNDGITNGADWYVIKGGMQDFNYLFTNCFDVTVEMACCKYPNATEIKKQWQRNIRSIFSFLKQVHSSICGIVSRHGVPIKGASIQIEGMSRDVKTTRRGEFWRLLIPGKTYKIRVVHGDQQSTFNSVTIPPNPNKCVKIDFELK